MSRDEKRCDSCIYYHAFNESGGECRNKPPAVFMSDERDVYTQFPTVSNNCFCGSGCWERFSDITKTNESYSYDELGSHSYFEHKELNKLAEKSEE